MADQIAANPLKKLAERKRFELSKGLPPYTLSRGAPRKSQHTIFGLSGPLEVPSRHDSTQYVSGTSGHYRWSDNLPLTQTSTAAQSSVAALLEDAP